MQISTAGRWLQPPSVSPITRQLSALNRFPSSHWGWISLGRLNGFSRPLNRFLGIGSNFSHSPPEWWWQELGFNIQPGGDFKEWHCTIQPDTEFNIQLNSTLDAMVSQYQWWKVLKKGESMFFLSNLSRTHTWSEIVKKKCQPTATYWCLHYTQHGSVLE